LVVNGEKREKNEDENENEDDLLGTRMEGEG
jgi:hypothetical protein